MSTLVWDGAPLPSREPVRGARLHARPRATTRSAGPAAGTLRLTARGRAVLTVLALLLAAWVAGPSGAFAGGPGEAEEVTAVTIGAGDTLWDIASAVARPDQDVRDVVARIADLNGLEGSGLVAGEQLLVPAGAGR